MKTPTASLPARRLTRVDEREFLPAVLEILETPPPPLAMWLPAIICLCLAATIAWSYFTHIDIYAVAQGKIQPSGRSKLVQPLETSKVAAVHVRNGQFVNAGDVLVELEHTESNAELLAARLTLLAQRAEIVRRRHAMDILASGHLAGTAIVFPPDIIQDIASRERNVLAAELGSLRTNLENLKAQIGEKTATRQRLSSTIEARAAQISHAEESAAMREQVNAKGAGSRSQVLDALQPLETLRTAQVSDLGQLTENNASAVSLERKIDAAIAEFASDQMTKLAEAERKRDILQSDLAKALAKAERTVLTAPISGTVQQLSVTTLGQVVTSAQSLLMIVPRDAPIEVEVMILNKDIGFVEAGQKAIVKVEAFPFTRFGTVEGRIMTVAHDAVGINETDGSRDTAGDVSKTQPKYSQNLVFPATLALATDKIITADQRLQLSPGMSVVAEIRTGERRVIDFVLSPLIEGASSAGHER
jgi:hemolysin D